MSDNEQVLIMDRFLFDDTLHDLAVKDVVQLEKDTTNVGIGDAEH